MAARWAETGFIYFAYGFHNINPLNHAVISAAGGVCKVLQRSKKNPLCRRDFQINQDFVFQLLKE
jgi:hypothetical protein